VNVKRITPGVLAGIAPPELGSRRFLEADDRPSRTSQPHSRTKMR